MTNKTGSVPTKTAEREFAVALDKLLRQTYASDLSREEQLGMLMRICAQMRREAMGSAVLVAEVVAQTLYDASREFNESPQLRPVAERMSLMGDRVLGRAYECRDGMDAESPNA